MSYSLEIYEILRSFGLFCPAPNVRDAVNSLTEEDLTQLSEDLVEFHKRNLPLVLEDLERHRKAFNAYPLCERGHTSPNFLRPLCLYAEKLMVRDPIYDALYNPAYVSPNVVAIKDGLASEIPFLLEIEPLVRAGILHLIPFMALQGPLIEAVNNNIKTDLGNKSWKEKIVGNIRYKLYPEQNALLMALGKPAVDSYHLFRYGRIVGHEETESGALLVKMVSPNSLLDNRLDISESDIFGWILSEINNEVIRTTRTIDENLLLSEVVNTTLVTNQEIYHELLELKVKSANVAAKALPFLAQFNLPFIDNLPMDKVVELREKEHDSFLDFRMTLQDLLHEIQTSDSSELKTAAHQIVEEQINPKIRSLDREFKRIRKKSFIRGIPRAVLASGALVTSVATGIPLLSALLSLTTLKLFKDVSDEYAEYLNSQMELKSNSMYFLWKAKQMSADTEKRKGYTVEGFPEKIQIDPRLFARKMEGLGISLYDDVLWKERHRDNKRHDSH